jgi:hypothetical protein
MAKPRNRFVLGLVLLACLLFFGCGVVSADTLSGRAQQTPWSGWWWPKKAGELVWGYSGRPSPVDKYDLYVSGSYPGPAFITASQQWYDPDAENWEGFCNGWVNASILEPEPAVETVLRGVLLKVGDKKGLLTACHAQDVINYLNCKNNPAIFHRYLVEYVGEKKQAIGADLDSSEEFWSYPVYAYEMEVNSYGDYDLVHCTIHYANDFVGFDFVGIDKKSRYYTYRLDKDSNGDYIGTGKWLEGMPKDLHPEWVWVPVGINQDELFVDYQKVAEMAHSPGEELQGSQLLPGHHVLLLKPGQDREFVIRPRPGEQVECRLALDRQTAYGSASEALLLKDGVEVSRLVLDRQLQSQEIIAAETGPQPEYRLVIRPGAENQDIQAVHLVVDVVSGNESWFYGFVKSGHWLGCGVAVPSGVDDPRAWIEIVDSSGFPLGCGAVTADNFASGESWLEVVKSQIPIDYNFASGPPAGVKLLTNFASRGLFLTGDYRNLSGDPLPGPRRNLELREMVFPWLTSSTDMVNHGTIFLHNPGQREVGITFNYFKKDGTPGNIGHLALEAGKIAEYRNGTYPGQGSIDGWVLVATEGELDGGNSLSKGKLIRDTLNPLSLGADWIIPHVAASAGWSTILGICNPRSEPIEIMVNAYVDGQKRGSPFQLTVDPHVRLELDLRPEMFGLTPAELDRAWLRLDSNEKYAGYLEFRFLDQSQAAIPLMAESGREAERILAPMAVSRGWWTGVVLLNSGQLQQLPRVSVLDADGRVLGSQVLDVSPLARVVVSLAALFPEVDPAKVMSFKLEDADGIGALTLFGGYYGNGLLAAECW